MPRGTHCFIRIAGGAIAVKVLAIYMEARIAGHAHEPMVGQTKDNSVSTGLRDTLFMFLETTGLPTEARLGVAEGYLRKVVSLKAHETRLSGRPPRPGELFSWAWSRPC